MTVSRWDRCAHVYHDTEQPCRSERWEHVHQPPPCPNGNDARHHEFVPEPPHEHKFERCICGAVEP